MYNKTNDQMTTYKTIELKNIIDECGSITITIAPNNRKSDDEAYDKTFTNFDEAKNEIEILESSNSVFF